MADSVVEKANGLKEEYNLRGFESNIAEPHKVESNIAEPHKVESHIVESPKVETSNIIRVYVQDHCPKCKGAVQRLRLKGVEFEVVNCMENKQEAIDLGLTQTPTIIDTNGKRYVGANAANEYLKDHE